MTYVFIIWISKTLFLNYRKRNRHEIVDTNHTLLPQPHHGQDASPIVGLTVVMILLVALVSIVTCVCWKIVKFFFVHGNNVMAYLRLQSWTFWSAAL